MSTVIINEPPTTTADLPATAIEPEPAQLVGMLAEYTTVGELLAGVGKVRAAGYRHWDVHSPFPIHGIEPAMGIRPTILPWLVLGMGLAGLVGGIGMMWFTNAYDYQYLISGKPIFSLPANIPVAFETTVLCASFTAVFGFLGLSRLPSWYNPLFKIERFRRATNDRFFIVIDAIDDRFDATRTADLLRSSGAAAVERVED
jgi:hypothetical protein